MEVRAGRPTGVGNPCRAAVDRHPRSNHDSIYCRFGRSSDPGGRGRKLRSSGVRQGGLSVPSVSGHASRGESPGEDRGEMQVRRPVGLHLQEGPMQVHQLPAEAPPARAFLSARHRLRVRASRVCDRLGSGRYWSVEQTNTGQPRAIASRKNRDSSCRALLAASSSGSISASSPKLAP